MSHREMENTRDY